MTEAITGVDLVKAQLRIAAGEKLADIVPERPKINGHAIECRINAEHPEKFTPAPARSRPSTCPAATASVWIPRSTAKAWCRRTTTRMIAKVICHGKDREEAMNKMQRALDQFVVEGIHTTIPLHQKIFADADFRRGDFDTKFMERFFEREAERKRPRS